MYRMIYNSIESDAQRISLPWDAVSGDRRANSLRHCQGQGRQTCLDENMTLADRAETGRIVARLGQRGILASRRMAESA